VLKELKDMFIPIQSKEIYIQGISQNLQLNFFVNLSNFKYELPDIQLHHTVQTLNIRARSFLENNHQSQPMVPNFTDVMLPEVAIFLCSVRPIKISTETYENRNIIIVGKIGYHNRLLEHKLYFKLPAPYHELKVALAGKVRGFHQPAAYSESSRLHPEVMFVPPKRELVNTIIVSETTTMDKRIIPDSILHANDITNGYSILPEWLHSGLILNKRQGVQVKILFESIYEVMLIAYVNELIVMTCILYACREILYTFISENSALTKTESPQYWSERESTLRKYPHMELRVYSAIHLKTSGVLTESQVNNKLSIKIICLIKEQSKDSYLHDRRKYPREVLLRVLRDRGSSYDLQSQFHLKK
jgi:hypothetical protein